MSAFIYRWILRLSQGVEDILVYVFYHMYPHYRPKGGILDTNSVTGNSEMYQTLWEVEKRINQLNEQMIQALLHEVDVVSAQLKALKQAGQGESYNDTRDGN